MFLLDRVTTLPKDYRNITKTLPDKLIKKPNVTKTLPQPYQKITKTLPSKRTHKSLKRHHSDLCYYLLSWKIKLRLLIIRLGFQNTRI